MFQNSRLPEMLIHTIVLFTAFPVHECAHGWAAEKMGDDTARKQGRITLNPFKHLSLMGTVCMIFAGFGWANPVPVDPRKFKDPKKGMAITALAGPVSNLIMAFAATVVFRILAVVYNSGHSTELLYALLYFFEYVIVLNVGLAVFNLLPIPPLDGSRIFNLVLSDKMYFKIMRYEKYVMIALIIVVYLGILDIPLAFLRSATLELMFLLTDWIEALMTSFGGAAAV